MSELIQEKRKAGENVDGDDLEEVTGTGSTVVVCPR